MRRQKGERLALEAHRQQGLAEYEGHVAQSSPQSLGTGPQVCPANPIGRTSARPGVLQGGPPSGQYHFKHKGRADIQESLPG